MSEKNLGNMIGWVDLAVGDLQRAMAFYGAVLEREMEFQSYEGIQFAVIEHGEGNGGCLIADPEFEPQSKGHLLYFTVSGRIRAAVEKAMSNGGSIIKDVHQIGPFGFRATILDSEGNRIALFSETDG